MESRSFFVTQVNNFRVTNFQKLKITVSGVAAVVVYQSRTKCVFDVFACFWEIAGEHLDAFSYKMRCWSGNSKVCRAAGCGFAVSLKSWAFKIEDVNFYFSMTPRRILRFHWRRSHKTDSFSDLPRPVLEEVSQNCLAASSIFGGLAQNVIFTERERERERASRCTKSYLFFTRKVVQKVWIIAAFHKFGLPPFWGPLTRFFFGRATTRDSFAFAQRDASDCKGSCAFVRTPPIGTLLPFLHNTEKHRKTPGEGKGNFRHRLLHMKLWKTTALWTRNARMWGCKHRHRLPRVAERWDFLPIWKQNLCPPPSFISFCNVWQSGGCSVAPTATVLLCILSMNGWNWLWLMPFTHNVHAWLGIKKMCVSM